MSRRIVLRVLGASTLSALLPLPLIGCSTEKPSPLSGSDTGPFFTDGERRALSALSTVVIPADATGPSGADLGATPFIERLLTAFDTNPPALFADGPYSGRQPAADGSHPPNDFVRYRPLDRVTELAWRIKLFGSQSVPGGAINVGLVDPVIGLRDLIRNNVRTAMRVSGATPLETLSFDQIKDAFINLDKAFQDVLVDLVPQAAFGAPEYGGNPNLAGWTMVHFEGDSQPYGYSIFDPATNTYHDRPDAPMTVADSGPDPIPLSNETMSLLQQVVGVTGGRKFL